MKVIKDIIQGAGYLGTLEEIRDEVENDEDSCEVICRECGNPTMNEEDLCYSCSQLDSHEID